MLLNNPKPIHLLYVPTMFCNMGCSYCYLGNLTNINKDNTRAVNTLRYAVELFTKNGYLPFNILFIKTSKLFIFISVKNPNFPA